MFDEEKKKKTLPSWGLQNATEKIQRGDSINYLGYNLGSHTQKIQSQSQKVQIKKDQLQTLNDFQKLLVYINWLQP